MMLWGAAAVHLQSVCSYTGVGMWWARKKLTGKAQKNNKRQKTQKKMWDQNNRVHVCIC